MPFQLVLLTQSFSLVIRMPLAKCQGAPFYDGHHNEGSTSGQAVQDFHSQRAQADGLN